MFAFGGVVGYLLTSRSLHRVSEEQLPIALLKVIFGMYASLVAAITLHELGHVFAGLAAGMKFRAVFVGPVGLTRGPNGFRLNFVRRLFTGGFASMIPGEGDLVSGFRAYIAGGPIVSVIWCAVCGAIFAALPSNVTMYLLAGAILILPGTLLPRIVRGVSTDARLLLQLRKEGPERRRLIALFQIQRAAMSGDRARDWSRSLLESAGELRDGSLDEQRLRYLAYWHFLDSGDIERARDELRRGYEVATSSGSENGLVGQVLAYEAAFDLARNGEVAEAERILAAVKSPHGLQDAPRYRAKAALLFAQGKVDEAQTAADRSRAALDLAAKRFGTNVSAERELLGRMFERETAAV